MEFHEYANIFPILGNAELEELRTDIEQNGLVEPIVLYEGKILDGRNRATACEALGIEPVFVEYTGNNPIAYVVSKNLKRRHLTTGQRAAIAAEIANMPPHRPEVSPKYLGLTSQEEAAKQLNVSDESIRQAKKVRETTPEVFQSLKEGKVGLQDALRITKFEPEQRKVIVEKIVNGKSVADVMREQKNAEKQANIENLCKQEAKMPDGTFHCIVIDPPWNYGTTYDADGRRVANPYPEMTQEELKELDIRAKDDCVLFLWTTQRFIWDAKELLEQWGFEYRSILVWDKEKMGMGDLLRMQCEFCLIGIKGKPILNNPQNIRDIIREARREHSRKPQGFYDIVETLCPYKKIEYFAREQRKGYEVYGNDTEKF